MRERVKKIAQETGLMQSQVFDYVLIGALEALEGEEGLQLPVRLKSRPIRSSHTCLIGSFVGTSA